MHAAVVTGGEAGRARDALRLSSPPLGTSYEQSFPFPLNEAKRESQKAKRRAREGLSTFARAVASHEAWHCACGGWGAWIEGYHTGRYTQPRLRSVRGNPRTLWAKLKRLGARVYRDGAEIRPEEKRGAVVCHSCGGIVDMVRVRREGKCKTTTTGGPRVRLVGKTVRQGPGKAARRTLHTNLRRCASGWRCPTCARIAQTQAGGELQAANLGYRREHGGGEVYLLTLTIPHAPGSKFEPLRRLVTLAYDRMHQGRAVQELRARLGIEASVRALEVKFGAAGPHPHVHALVFCKARLTKAGEGALLAWYRERWVRQLIAAGYVDRDDMRARAAVDAHAVHLAVADKEGAYLAKMGLTDELSGDLHKHEAHCPACNKRVGYVWSDGRRCEACGAELGRTPLQILADYAEHGRAEDCRLWREYWRGIGGARRLTWSRWGDGVDLRKAYPDTPPKAGQVAPGAELTLTVDLDAWRELPPTTRADIEGAVREGDRHSLHVLVPQAFATRPGFAPDDPEPPHPDDPGLFRYTKEERRELAQVLN